MKQSKKRSNFIKFITRKGRRRKFYNRKQIIDIVTDFLKLQRKEYHKSLSDADIKMIEECLNIPHRRKDALKEAYFLSTRLFVVKLYLYNKLMKETL